MIHLRMQGSCLAVLALAAATTVNAQGPNLAPGYIATKFFQSSVPTNMTGLATDDAGQVYCVYNNGAVGRLSDLDGDGVAELIEPVWLGGNTPSVTGILWFGDKLYMSELGAISLIEDTDGDGVLDQKTTIVDDLPNGWHQNNGLFRDQIRIYFGLGSISDHDVDPDPRSGTLMFLTPGSSFPLTYAKGIRNAYDGAVHPITGDIFVGDNGPNRVPGLPHPVDEINLVRFGRNYGHPNFWGSGSPAPFVDPLVELPAHSSPCGMTFNQNVGMSGYRNELVVAGLSGDSSSIFKLPVIYGQAFGSIQSFYEVFADGFDSAIDVVFDDQGAMYVAEYAGSQTIYRIVQESDARLIIENRPSIGQTVEITLEVPGAPYFLSIPVASLALGPPISLGPGLTLWLDVFSPIFRASLSPSRAVFDFPIPTVLDAQGLASIRIHLPDDPTLVGAEIQLQHIVFDPLTVLPTAVSPPQSLRILEAF